jgi:hypothetical protein
MIRYDKYGLVVVLDGFSMVCGGIPPFLVQQCVNSLLGSVEVDP